LLLAALRREDDQEDDRPAIRTYQRIEIRSKAPKVQVQVQVAILPWADVKVFIWRARPRPYEFVLAMNIGTARDDIALEILTMLGAGLYRCNSLYNQVGTKYRSFYPLNPLTRTPTEMDQS
jgi:hypothetical protein